MSIVIYKSYLQSESTYHGATFLATFVTKCNKTGFCFQSTF